MSTIDTIRASDSASTGVPSTENRGLFHLSSRLIEWLNNAMVKHRTRQHLSELSDDMLDDVGIAPSQARREIKRLFWD
ncbi:DUF1127 domain-containing protein [Phyllobacterium lublinensis]|uniref:DUF1127 domain-containing protein n=1 Tax=Phyllobacterium lublinensis TaxID=2875708 RepID=UPI001CCB7491|nr:DUF1127 domain-containing protein [Phyllobacterium sp. 2063]MBZ9653399.1 DUF1127 domain-containing protein [Phyllobacterium sp. 2063]